MARLALFLLLLAAALACRAAQPERVAIAGENGLALPGYWFPAPGSAPRPAILSLHGCGGPLDSKGRLNQVFFRDAGYFNSERIHLLAIDSFTPRGHKSLCETRPRYRDVTVFDRRRDVLAAMRWLAQRPEVDAARIAVVGRSNGAQTVLVLLDRQARIAEGIALRPRAAVALYPGCTAQLRNFSYEIDAPLLVLAGELDDWTPPKPCVELHRKVLDHQKDAVFEIEVYPGSYHGFDGTGTPRPRENIPGVKSGRVTVGGNPAARRAAYPRMFDFLARELDIPLALSHEARFRFPPAGEPAR